MADAMPMLFVPIGDNPARPFGMAARERASRLAANNGFACADRVLPGRAALLASMAYGWDPAWLAALAARPRTVLTLGGEPVMAHVPAQEDGTPIAEALKAGARIEGYEMLPAESAELSYGALRKRARPFVLHLGPGGCDEVEHAAYDAAYKRVTDALTLHLWRKPAFYLTRFAARARLSPNAVTALGALLCIAAFFLFWRGDYWLGTLAGFLFMVLDTVDGQLARCTGTASRWGNMLDHGIDLVHPPFWWWAWLHGLYAYGRPLEPLHATMVLSIILGGYIGQRFIEALSLMRFAGLEIHVWRPLDSKFRLITARRNPNMAILVASLVLHRPDVGLEMVAWWTLVSLIFHAVRLAQMTELKAHGRTIISWLEA